MNNNILRFPNLKLLELTEKKVKKLEKQVEAFNELLQILHSPIWFALTSEKKIEMVDAFAKKYENKYETMS